MKDFKSLVNSRQSCRDFNGEQVTKEEIDKVLEIARLSPSACNSQPWKVYVAISPEKCKEVAKTLQDRGRNKFVDNATCFVAVAEKPRPLKPEIADRIRIDHFMKYDIGEYVAYFTLAAKELGLETCIIGWIKHDELKEVLNMPNDQICNLVIAVGKSTCEIREKKRLEISDTVKFL